MTLIAPVEGGGVVNVSQKWAGLAASGLLEVGGLQGLGRAATPRLYDQHDVGQRPLTARALEDLGCPRALGVGILEPVGLDRVENRGAADRSRDRDKKRGEHDPSPPPICVLPEAPHPGDHMKRSTTGATLNGADIGYWDLSTVGWA